MLSTIFKPKNTQADHTALKNVENNLQALLKKFEIDHHVSIKTIQKWVEERDNNKDQISFFGYLSMLMGLIPYQYDREDIVEIGRGFVNYWRNYFKASGKNIKNINADMEVFEDMTVGSLEWQKYFNKGKDLMEENKLEEALENYDKLFQIFLEQQTTYPEIYRAFFNKGMCHFLLGDVAQGLALIKIAYTINPKYQLAAQALKNYEEGELDNVIQLRMLKRTFSGLQKEKERNKKWDYDKIRKEWSTEKILNQLEKFDISISKNEFQAKAQEYLCIDDMDREIFNPQFSGSEEDRDFIWRAIYTLWDRWWNEKMFATVHFSEIIRDTEEDINNYNQVDFLERNINLIEHYIIHAPKKFFKAWKRTFEYDNDEYGLTQILIKLIENRDLREKTISLANNLQRKTQHAYYGLVSVYAQLINNNNWQQEIKKLIKAEPYDCRIPVIFAYLIDRFNNNKEWMESYLQKGLEMVENRDKDKKYELKEEKSTIYDDYKYVLENLLSFYKEEKKNESVKKIQNYIEDIKKRKEELFFSSKLQKMDDKFEEIMRDHAKQKFEKDPGLIYFDFLQRFHINFETDKEPELKPILIDPYEDKVVKIGRNEPCLCGSKKKFKKCCGR